MIKMSVFNETNDFLIVDTFKDVFQRRSSVLAVKYLSWTSWSLEQSKSICFTVNTVSHFVHVGWSSSESR